MNEMSSMIMESMSDTDLSLDDVDYEPSGIFKVLLSLFDTFLLTACLVAWLLSLLLRQLICCNRPDLTSMVDRMLKMKISGGSRGGGA